MKKLISLVLLFSLSGQYFVKTGFVSWFEINQAAIINAFCINKEKPELECDGKCYLKKELKSVEKDQESAGKSTVNAEQHIFLQPDSIRQIISFPSIPKTGKALIRNLYFYIFSESLLRPPQL